MLLVACQPSYVANTLHILDEIPRFHTFNLDAFTTVSNHESPNGPSIFSGTSLPELTQQFFS
jgi:hypothetical protein